MNDEEYNEYKQKQVFGFTQKELDKERDEKEAKKIINRIKNIFKKHRSKKCN